MNGYQPKTSVLNQPPNKGSNVQPAVRSSFRLSRGFKNMTRFECILQSMSVAEYANMKADANECPSTRTIGQCAQYKNNHERSTACFFCWVHWLQEEA